MRSISSIAFCPTSADPELAGLAIEREAPGVAQADRVDLGPPAAPGVRVVPRNGVGLAPIDVDSQDLAEQLVGILGAVLRIAARAAIAHADVEETIRSERNHAAIVVGVGLRDGQEDPLR